MISALGPYAFFIVTSYALVAAVVVILIVWTAADARTQRNALDRLEGSGIRRRSSKTDEAS